MDDVIIQLIASQSPHIFIQTPPKLTCTSKSPGSTFHLQLMTTLRMAQKELLKKIEVIFELAHF
jgi:hypothetical protein